MWLSGSPQGQTVQCHTRATSQTLQDSLSLFHDKVNNRKTRKTEQAAYLEEKLGERVFFLT